MCHYCRRFTCPAVRGYSENPNCRHYWCQRCACLQCRLSPAKIIESAWRCPNCDGTWYF